MFSSIAELCHRVRVWGAGKPAGSTRRRVARRKVSLQVEALEQRDVPTVAILPNPAFGPPTILGSLSDGMKNPEVILLFSGNYWTTPAGHQDFTTLGNYAQAIMSGPYLSGLTEYGVDPTNSYIESQWIPDTVTIDNPTALPNQRNADAGKLQDMLNNDINNGTAPPPGDSSWQRAPIYVVISDPTSSKGSSVGWNAPGKYEEHFWQYDNLHMIWMSTATGPNGLVNRDQFTDMFSHELAETLTDPDSNGITISPGAGFPQSLRATGTLQISDDEPDNMRYTYRLPYGNSQAAGYLVQAYWSNLHKEYIVPDGNSQTVVLQPIWNGANFNNKFNLTVAGDQFGVNDSITLDAIAGGSANTTGTGNVSLTFNQQRFVFDPGTITGLTVDTGSGSDTVQVNAVPAAVALLTLESDTGTDAVNIGNGTLAGISTKTAISVKNSLGQSSLFINGYQGGLADVTVLNNSIIYNGIAISYETAIAYTRNRVTGISVSHAWGVTSIEIDAANGSWIDAESVNAYTTTTVDIGPTDPVTGPAAGQLHVHRRSSIYDPIVVYRAGNPVAGAYA